MKVTKVSTSHPVSRFTFDITHEDTNYRVVHTIYQTFKGESKSYFDVFELRPSAAEDGEVWPCLLEPCDVTRELEEFVESVNRING